MKIALEELKKTKMEYIPELSLLPMHNSAYNREFDDEYIKSILSTPETKIDQNLVRIRFEK